MTLIGWRPFGQQVHGEPLVQHAAKLGKKAVLIHGSRDHTREGEAGPTILTALQDVIHPASRGQDGAGYPVGLLFGLDRVARLRGAGLPLEQAVEPRGAAAICVLAGGAAAWGEIVNEESLRRVAEVVAAARGGRGPP